MADSRAAVSGLEDALARAEAQGSAAQAAHATALAAREADLQQQRAAQAHAQELLADVQGSYASLQDRHRQLVQEHEVQYPAACPVLHAHVSTLASLLCGHVGADAHAWCRTVRSGMQLSVLQA